VVTETDFLTSFRCASELLDRRRLQGIPIPGWLSEHYQRMRAMSATGHQIDSEVTQSEPELIGVAEAAQITGYSQRHIRRIASDLDGQKVGPNWMFSRRAVQDYAEGRHE
jgi:hypothetical protein